MWWLILLFLPLKLTETSLKPIILPYASPQFFLMAIPKKLPSTTTKSTITTTTTTTVQPRTTVDIVRSIEIDVSKESPGHIMERPKKKRSDDFANVPSTVLFRPQTVKGFCSLFGGTNTTKDMSGPVLVAKGPVNILVEDPGLVNVMYNDKSRDVNDDNTF